jgi:hypothetical protein
VRTGVEPDEHDADPLASIVRLDPRHGLFAQRGFASGALTASSRAVFWTAAASDEADDVLLLRRDLRTGSSAVVAHHLSQTFGVGIASAFVVYATDSASGVRLEASRLAGDDARVLSHSLSAPFDARGDVVAWAEADAAHNRVVALNLRTGARSLAYAAAPCGGARCYRIDRVTVADAGLVFGLDSVGQGYPSLIARRSWDAARPSFVRVPNDPQPDLARSSAGALYYQLGRGWMQWDFDRSQPTTTWPHGMRPWLLAREGTRDVLLDGPTCGTTVAVRVRDGDTTVLPAPTSTPATAKGFGKICRKLTGVAWAGRRLLLAWSLTPRISDEAHEDEGVSSVVTAADVG